MWPSVDKCQYHQLHKFEDCLLKEAKESPDILEPCDVLLSDLKCLDKYIGTNIGLDMGSTYTDADVERRGRYEVIGV